METNSIIHTPTNQIEKSIAFYTTLGFQYQTLNGMHLASDSQCVIEINPDRFARAGVKLFRPSWGSIVAQLKTFVHLFKVPNGFH